MARPISDEELQLKRRARRRLIGAIVLVSAIVVALPMLLDTEPKPLNGEVGIKIPSPESGGFTSRVVPVTPEGTKSAPASKPSPEAKTGPKVAAAPSEKAATASGSQAAPGAAPEKIAKAPQADTPAKAAKTASKKPPAKQPAGPPFVVQVIALADTEKAKQVQAQVAAAGVKSYTEVVKTAKGDVTRVRAGPFATRAAAEKALDQLKAAGLSGAIAAK